jgi:hypothetical protein
MISWLPTRDARVVYEGRLLHFRLPIWTLLVDKEEGRSSYCGLGFPDLSSTSGDWRFVEQLGSAHMFRGYGMALTIVTRQRTRWLTQMDLIVRPLGDESSRTGLGG